MWILLNIVISCRILIMCLVVYLLTPFVVQFLFFKIKNVTSFYIICTKCVIVLSYINTKIVIIRRVTHLSLSWGLYRMCSHGGI